MSDVDWSKAPDWADRAGLFDGDASKRMAWSSRVKYKYFNGASTHWYKDSASLSATCFSAIEMRLDEWQKGEERMDQVSQNGNDGEHYAELDDFDKQPRYKGDDGLDWIDEFARDNSISDFRAAMRFTIGKYEKRLGKKDAMSKELYKISDYYKRWSEVEKKIELDGLAKIKEFMEQEK